MCAHSVWEGWRGEYNERRTDEQLTLFIELVVLVLCAVAVENALRVATVRAVAFAEDHDGVVVDHGLGLLLCGFHCDWCSRCAGEESEEKGHGYVCVVLSGGGMRFLGLRK